MFHCIVASYSTRLVDIIPCSFALHNCYATKGARRGSLSPSVVSVVQRILHEQIRLIQEMNCFAVFGYYDSCQETQFCCRIGGAVEVSEARDFSESIFQEL